MAGGTRSAGAEATRARLGLGLGVGLGLDGRRHEESWGRGDKSAAEQRCTRVGPSDLEDAYLWRVRG